MEIIAKEVAGKELEAWFDLMDAPKEMREGPNGEIMKNALATGKIVIEPNGTLTQKLKHPFGKELKISELKYTNQGLAIGKINDHLSNLDLNFEGRNSLAHIAEATGENTKVLQNLSAKDFNLAKAIIIFFIV